jgi:anti-sigma factor RsiW
MNRRCEESVPLLGPWIDGELPGEDRAWLAEHVAGCDACATRKALLAAQRDAIRDSVLRRAQAADLSGIAGAVMTRVANERPPAQVIRLRVWGEEMWEAHRASISAAAGLAVAASIALLAVLAPSRADRTQPTLIADARVGSGTIVEAVDFENHEGAVLQSGQTTLIWIDDDSPAVLR